MRFGYSRLCYAILLVGLNALGHAVEQGAGLLGGSAAPNAAVKYIMSLDCTLPFSTDQAKQLEWLAARSPEAVRALQCSVDTAGAGDNHTPPR